LLWAVAAVISPLCTASSAKDLVHFALAHAGFLCNSSLTPRSIPFRRLLRGNLYYPGFLKRQNPVLNAIDDKKEVRYKKALNLHMLHNYFGNSPQTKDIFISP
jgi:hypothetical protein